MSSIPPPIPPLTQQIGAERPAAPKLSAGPANTGPRHTAAEDTGRVRNDACLFYQVTRVNPKLAREQNHDLVYLYEDYVAALSEHGDVANADCGEEPDY